MLRIDKVHFGQRSTSRMTFQTASDRASISISRWNWRPGYAGSMMVRGLAYQCFGLPSRAGTSSPPPFWPSLQLADFALLDRFGSERHLVTLCNVSHKQ